MLMFPFLFCKYVTTYYFAVIKVCSLNKCTRVNIVAKNNNGVVVRVTGVALLTVDRRLRFHKPRYEPRTHFIYNNYMYMLAGYVSERLADDTWEQLVRERIFKPLAMTSSKFTPELDDDDEIASPYVFRSGRLQKVDRVVLQ